jgi:hypothetical protein
MYSPVARMQAYCNCRHACRRGVRESGWGRTGPDSIADFTDIIWINTTRSKRQFPF